MDQSTAVPEQVARYLAGQLSTEETRDFEALMARQPEIAAELESAARFRAGLAALRERGELAALLKPRAPARRWLQTGIAASLAVLAAGVGLWIRFEPATAPLLSGTLAPLHASGGDSQDELQSYRFVTNRDARNTAVQVELRARHNVLEFSILPDRSAGEAQSYRVALDAVTDGGVASELATASSLRADADGFVHVYADSARLRQGAYELVITDEATTAPGAATRYRLVIR